MLRAFCHRLCDLLPVSGLQYILNLHIKYTQICRKCVYHKSAVIHQAISQGINNHNTRVLCVQKWQVNQYPILSPFHISLQIQCYDNEPWYHGQMTCTEAETLLQKYKYLGDGAFLVRESKRCRGKYSVDFL